jgi:hypothetical protein
MPAPELAAPAEPASASTLAFAPASTPASVPGPAALAALDASRYATPPDLNLPQFVRGIREFYLGMLHGHLQSPQFDSVRAVDAAWLTALVLESQGQPLPSTPQVDMTVSEMAAFQRFCECVEDNEGFDVDKDMMRRLADIGLVRSQGFGRYATTSYGAAVRAATTR